MEPAGSILESIGSEIIGVMSPVSICMFLVVLLVYTSSSTTNPAATTTVRTAANLVYVESPTDTAAQKLEGALLDAVVFIILIAVVTFVIVLLYYYNFTNFLKYYTKFSAFVVFSFMGGPIFLTVIQHFNVPIDAITCAVLLFNFTAVGVVSIFSNGVPILVRQGYLVGLGIIVAAWFTRLPEWTTWVLLVALALYDLVAVLAPGGPLKILVELASSREEELPALVYEARPGNVSRARGSGLGALLVTGVTSDEHEGTSAGVEMQAVRLSNRSSGNANRGGSRHNVGGMGSEREEEDEIDVMRDDQGETSPLMAGNSRRSPMGERGVTDVENGANAGRVSNEVSVVEMISGNGRQGTEGDYDDDDEVMNGRGIKLGLGDFVFYSVLVGRAAMYDLMTVYACYLAIISGLGCTLILLAVRRHALPALPISIALGLVFYFLTRLLMEPFLVGMSTNFIMF